jgi:hypothetical protein
VAGTASTEGRKANHLAIRKAVAFHTAQTKGAGKIKENYRHRYIARLLSDDSFP